MKKNIILLLIICLGCIKKDKGYDLPIEKEKLKAILIDLYIAGAAVEVNPSKNKDSLKRIYHTEICKIHKISSKELLSVTEMLHENQNINSQIQKEVLDSLNVIQRNSYK